MKERRGPQTPEAWRRAEIDGAGGLTTTFAMRPLVVAVLAAVAGGCAVSRSASGPVGAPEPPQAQSDSVAFESGVCAECASGPLDQSLTVRSTERVAELKSRGGQCARYGTVLEASLREGRVTLRPFMWRVGGHLVSGEARDDGAIVVARHIDPLNIGVRTIEDVIWTLEHEAAHTAFQIPNGLDAGGDRANALVRQCREDSGSETRSPTR